MGKNPFKTIFHWLLGHVMFEVLKWIVGGGIIMMIGILWTFIRESSSVIGYIIIASGLLAVAIGIFLSIFLSRRPILQILSPVDGDEVGFEHIVRISSTLCIPFQLLILSGDKLWHLQKRDFSTEGSLYSINCQFGNKDNPRPPNNPKGEHIIQAIAGSEVKESVIESLPKGVLKSRPIHVYRKSLTEVVQIINKESKLEEYFLKLGVYWDYQLNPFCLKCKMPLTGSSLGGHILHCPNCNLDFTLRDGDTIYTLDKARWAIRLKFPLW